MNITLSDNKISIMIDTEDDSSISDNDWTVNETWLIGILTENHNCNEADIKNLVRQEL